MIFYDVLCLKSILGFLLSERTSGVSPVIFSFVHITNEQMFHCAMEIKWGFIVVKYKLCVFALECDLAKEWPPIFGA